MLIMFIGHYNLLSTFPSVPKLSPLSKNYKRNHPIFVFLSLSEILVVVLHFSVLPASLRYAKLAHNLLKAHQHQNHRAVWIARLHRFFFFFGGSWLSPAPFFCILTPVKPRRSLSVSSASQLPHLWL